MIRPLQSTGGKDEGKVVSSRLEEGMEDGERGMADLSYCLSAWMCLHLLALIVYDREHSIRLLYLRNACVARNDVTLTNCSPSSLVRTTT